MTRNFGEICPNLGRKRISDTNINKVGVQIGTIILTGLWRLEFEAYTKILSFLPFDLVFLTDKIYHVFKKS